MSITTRRPGGAPRLHPLALSLALAGVLAGCGGGDANDPAVAAGRQTGATGAVSGTAAAAATQVCFYEHVNYGGASTCLSASSAWIGNAWNDRVSSVRVPAGFKVQLFADINYGGRSITLSADNANLVGAGFNDATSSLKITTPPAAAKVTLASVQFAQSMLYGSSDSQLVLVANKPTLLKVNVTAPAGTAAPTATVRIDNTLDGSSRDLVLSAPRRGLPTTVSETQSFDDAYSVSVPAELVKSGLKVTVNVAGAAAQSFTPRVGGGVAMRFVPIPVKIAGTTGQLPVDQSAHLRALFPVSSVTLRSHPTFVSAKVTSLPATDAQWSDAFGKILGELNDLHRIEGAGRQDYYFGFIPKRTWGLAGLGYVPGTSAVGFDMPSNPDTVRDVVAHELGHNFSLPHAACGGAGSPDPKYPYPDANLGKPGRYIWSYLSDTNTFYDPRPTDRHDIMSYCGGTVFSDYNYRLMQTFLTPGDAAAAQVKGAAASSDGDAKVSPQDVLLVSGSIRGKQVEINPVKTLVAKPDAAGGPYVLRVQTVTGDVKEVAFTAQALDHDGELLHFSVLVPKLDNIASISVLRDGATLGQAQARVSNARQKALASGASRALVRLSEAGGKAVLRWDAEATPFLSVTWTDGTRRLNLAQDLQGGEATLDTHELPAGGRFEFIVSDGLNAQRIELAR
ncbi:peptidase inhibitor family I36 protein [Mitsuaria sp. GD03876]|uniref:peptidase inhibitor family I36 protein n=1 Tax=Mitsuaria sp. GD03876 TaxID=2975399 RepID=UPI0024490274|nr:peptidase inhibitor family I36 protein [Mitsuaria sp. GD03876]MDH0864567.1 peptidase inhibitor family I36 protein [Mitsuaria sp. GD03876]